MDRLQKQVARRWGRVCRRYSIRDELESGVIEEGGLVGGNRARGQLDGRFTLERFWLAGSCHGSRRCWESVAARAFVVTVRTPSVSFFYLCRTASPCAQQGSQTALWQWWAAQGRRRLCLASDASNQICAQTCADYLVNVTLYEHANWSSLTCTRTGVLPGRELNGVLDNVNLGECVETKTQWKQKVVRVVAVVAGLRHIYSGVVKPAPVTWGQAFGVTDPIRLPQLWVL